MSNKSSITAIACLACVASLPAQTGRVEFLVNDPVSSRPVPCRLHLKDPAGKPVRAENLPFFRDHFVCAGTVGLDLAPGPYAYEIERGPEYGLVSGSVQIAAGSKTSVVTRLERRVDMAAEGWWSGELHVHRPLADIELLMQAEDLHVAPVMTWWNKQNLWAGQPLPERILVQFDGNRFYQKMAGEDEREGGALLFFNLKEPLHIAQATREFPSPMKFLAEARQLAGARVSTPAAQSPAQTRDAAGDSRAPVWIDIEKPFWWDVPVWLASGQVDSVGLANNHMCRDSMYENEAWGRPRDAQRLPPPRGNGFWTQEIYYHILNCGLRIPPSAGSASGVLPNPVGYNRVYVHLGDRLTYENWWEGLRAGRSFVSNGPLLRCKANGKLPGHVFKGNESKAITLEGLLSSRDPVSHIEIIRNGRVERTVPFAESQRTVKLGTLNFTESGWFLVRAIADNPKTFRFASSAPWYVEAGAAKRRISRSSSKFFLDWVHERAQRVKLDDPKQKEEVLSHHVMAESFWREKITQANAE